MYKFLSVLQQLFIRYMAMREREQEFKGKRTMRTIQMKSKMRSKLRWKGREADQRLIREPPGSEQIGLFCCGLPWSVVSWPRFPHGQRWAVVLAKVWLLAGMIVPYQSLISLSSLPSQLQPHFLFHLNCSHCSFPFKFLFSLSQPYT